MRRARARRRVDRDPFRQLTSALFRCSLCQPFGVFVRLLHAQFCAQARRRRRLLRGRRRHERRGHSQPIATLQGAERRSASTHSGRLPVPPRRLRTARPAKARRCTTSDCSRYGTGAVSERRMNRILPVGSPPGSTATHRGSLRSARPTPSMTRCRLLHRSRDVLEPCLAWTRIHRATFTAPIVTRPGSCTRLPLYPNFATVPGSGVRLYTGSVNICRPLPGNFTVTLSRPAPRSDILRREQRHRACRRVHQIARKARREIVHDFLGVTRDTYLRHRSC